MARRSSAERDIEEKLKALRADYEAKEGQAFAHFFCPVLFRDEPTELCRGHIINKAFPNTSRAWTVQRKDVDNFFGTNFEADFVNLREAQARDVLDRVFDDPQLHTKLSPRILLNGEQVGHYGLRKTRLPEKFTAVGLDRPGAVTPIALKMSPEVVASSLTGDWQIEINCDLRLSAFVSLLKAAHLSLFEVLGYRYALSAAGHFLGKQILGAFFSAQRNKPKAEVIHAAKTYFAEFATMLRPVSEPDTSIKGTVADREFLFVTPAVVASGARLCLFGQASYCTPSCYLYGTDPTWFQCFSTSSRMIMRKSMHLGPSTPIEVGGLSQRGFT